jgi:hypothetical protein
MGRASSRKAPAAATTKPARTRSTRPPATPRPKKKRRAGGSSAKRTGSRYELEFIEELSKKGIAAQRVPLSGAVGGHFGSDVMVFPSPLTSFSVEVKYRSSSNGLKNFLAAWQALGAVPLRFDRFLLMRLDDFPRLLADHELHALVPLEVPALIHAWMAQAEVTFGMLAIRLPKRELEHRWVVVIDASSEALLRQVNWPSSATC